MKNSRWKKVGVVCVILMTGILSIAAFLYFRTDLREASRDFEKNRLEAKKMGLAFDLEAVRKIYAVDESENAAPVVASVNIISDETSRRANIFEASEAEFLRFWKLHETDFHKLELASNKQRLREVKEPKPPSSLMSDPNEVPSLTASLKLWTLLIARRAEIASSKNQFQETRRFLMMAAKLTNLVGDEPILLTALRRINCSSNVTRSLSKIMATHGQEPTWRQMITEVLDILDKPVDFASILKVEHWLSLKGAMVLNGEATDPHPFYQNISREILFARLIPTFKSATYSRVNQIYLQYLATLPQTPIDYRKWKSDWQHIEDIHSQKRFSMLVASIAIIPSSDFIGMFHFNSVRRNLIRQALEFLRTNRNPIEGLPLGGFYALDLDGKPLRLKKTAKDWIIYSVGVDGIDNGGEEKKSKGFDIVIHLPSK